MNYTTLQFSVEAGYGVRTRKEGKLQIISKFDVETGYEFQGEAKLSSLFFQVAPSNPPNTS